MDRAAEKSALCASCGERARWVVTHQGRPTPVCLRHLNHWQTPPAKTLHEYGDASDCVCGRNFSTVRGLREHITKARAKS